MPKYRVKTNFMEVFSCVVEADNQEDAEKIAFDLVGDLVPVDVYWHDSNTVQVDDNTPTDN